MADAPTFHMVRRTQARGLASAKVQGLQVRLRPTTHTLCQPVRPEERGRLNRATSQRSLELVDRGPLAW